MQFLLESLSDLHSSLKGRGSRLIVRISSHRKVLLCAVQAHANNA